ncbi:hypothetical protein Oter_3768 [Opitutus terrae PB90-1]|uniref:Uncharacterized protein n=2 Tax=Opitutus terrae TaxID=107709 RepID=B1ZYE5_OPITP|nr:hypothetical protein Oter_3768 [Opitutus terrae PB90-1]
MSVASVAGSEWLQRVALTEQAGEIEVPPGGEVSFLRFGDHSYEPARMTTLSGQAIELRGKKSQLVAPFQQLWAVTWRLPEELAGAKVGVESPRARDAFWDQVLGVRVEALGELPRYRLVETGDFGAALPEHVRAISFSPAEIRRQQQSLVDPVIPPGLAREMSWAELEAAAFPLDFQKVLLASFNDSSPGFAYQNGQWLTTWPSREAAGGGKEDHWFAPALLIGERLIRPAPLSARTSFLKTDDGRTLPCWEIEWRCGEIVVRQQLFSWRAGADAVARVHVRFELRGASDDVRLALGMGRRPNVHHWDDRTRERTPIPFFVLAPGYRRADAQVVDEWGHEVFSSAQRFELQPLGPVEMLATFEPDETGCVHIRLHKPTRRRRTQASGRRNFGGPSTSSAEVGCPG